MKVNLYENIDWSKNVRIYPKNYVIGKGEFGVLMFEPYKSEILPFWKYKNEKIAEISAKNIFSMFENYLNKNDIIGADMTRKFLQMGFTRSMRYAKYKGGKKYKDNSIQDAIIWYDEEKRKGALIFKHYWDLCRNNIEYKHKLNEFFLVKE